MSRRKSKNSTVGIRRSLKAGATAALTGSSLFLGVGCSEQPVEIAKNAPIERSVKTYTIMNYEEARERTYLGRVRSPKQIDLDFELAGRIASLEVRAGMPLAASQEVARLDATQMELDHARAVANLSLAKKELFRIRRLYESGSGTKAELDRIENSHTQAEIIVGKTKENLVDSVLRAPFEGRVAQLLVEQGSFVGPGEPVVVFQETGIGEIEFHLTEGQLRNLVNGLAAGEASARVAEGPADGALLELKDFATKPDPLTGAYKVTMRAMGIDEVDLLPGAPVRVKIEERLQPSERLVQLPADALVPQAESQFRVWIVSEEMDTPVARVVSVGSASGDYVEVTGGLEPGDQVVVSGATRLRSDSRIAILQDS